jgi:hypothetical protein
MRRKSSVSPISLMVLLILALLSVIQLSGHELQCSLISDPDDRTLVAEGSVKVEQKDDQKVLRIGSLYMFNLATYDEVEKFNGTFEVWLSGMRHDPKVTIVGTLWYIGDEERTSPLKYQLARLRMESNDHCTCEALKTREDRPAGLFIRRRPQS